MHACIESVAIIEQIPVNADICLFCVDLCCVDATHSLFDPSTAEEGQGTEKESSESWIEKEDRQGHHYICFQLILGN